MAQQQPAETTNPSNPVILAVGATGPFAGFVVPELVKRGATVRALLRDEDTEEKVRKRGASQIVIGDLRNRASLDSALEGIDSVFHIGPAFQSDETDMGLNMVEAASAAGVEHFVFSSVAHIAADLEHHTAKLPVERAIFESGMQYTILRPTFFYQNFDQQWSKITGAGKLTSPFSVHSPFAFVDYRDVAEVAATALTSKRKRLAYGVFNLCGDGNFSFEEVADLISHVIGRPVTAEHVSPSSWASAAGIPTDTHEWKLMEAMFKDYDDHGLPGNSITLRAVLERKPRSLKSYINELASSMQ